MRKDTKLTVRIPADLALRIEAFGNAELLTEAAAVRQLLEVGLAFGRKILTGEDAERALEKAIRDALKP